MANEMAVGGQVQVHDYGKSTCVHTPLGGGGASRLLYTVQSASIQLQSAYISPLGLCVFLVILQAPVGRQ